MPNKASRGTVGAGRFRTGAGQEALMSMSGTVARTDTTAKNLFKLPAGAILELLLIGGTVASDAGTSAVLDVGKTGTDNFFVASHDVKTAGSGDAANAAVTKNRGDQGGIQVTGKHTEAGVASTTGGPWTVTALFHL